MERVLTNNKSVVKMKILLANSPFRGGGITTYAVQLIRCLAEDAELAVVLADDKKSPITDKRVKVYHYNTQNLSVKNARFFIRLINEEIKPDVLIISAANILPVIAPYLNDNIKIISVSHSGRFFHSEYSAVNHKYIDNIIAASSEYNKEYLLRKCHVKDSDKIKVIYNFLDKDEELENLRYLKPQKRPISLIFVNGGSVHKSPDLVARIVIELLKTDLNFRFYWMGTSTIPLTTTLFRHSKFKNVKQLFPDDKRLVFPGYIASKRDFDKFTASANIMLAPSRNEGCSMALLEGHRAGCIFLVADYENSNREIVEKGNSGLVVNRNDIDGFISIISDIINNPSKYEDYYENSHNTFITYLSYPIWKEKIFSVINSPSSHSRRKKNSNRLGLIINIFKMKWLLLSCQIDQTLRYSFPSFYTFRKLYYTIGLKGAKMQKTTNKHF